ncbi:MAG TPA: SDR family oxidoreductase [Gaiellales bacterium]|jgi:2-deoxy-D-gluconate 3-dehydrogenase|nr:SDR family oxidoreductase [Gaiellales bacterium]
MPGVLDSFRLDGHVACITGTTRGIGQAAAIALAEAGCDIVHIDRSDPAETRARVEALGRRSALVPLDLEQADADACERAIQAAAAAFGRLDVLVNSAGVVARGSVLDVSAEEAERVLHVNLHCVLALSRAAGRGFVEQGSGAIVNVASLLSFQGGVLVSSYATAKHGVLGLTRAFANEWASHGVRVNALAPGYIATDFTERLRADRVRYEELLSRIPAGRWGSPEDLAGAFVYLCSPASRYVTGTVLTVDGGWMSR